MSYIVVVLLEFNDYIIVPYKELMKKQILLISLCLLFMKFVSSQVLCVQCFDQNTRIGIGTNNLVVNGGFENTTCGFNVFPNTFCPNANSYASQGCTIANWICTGGGSSTYAGFWNTSEFYVAEGTHSVYMGNFLSNSCSSSGSTSSTGVNDDTSCFVRSGCVITGIPPGYPINPSANYGGANALTLTQTINGLTIGNTYVLEFWAGGEAELNYPVAQGLFAVDVGFGNIFLRCNPTSIYDSIGTRYVIQFKAISSSHSIKFKNWGHPCYTCSEPILDDVRLYAPDFLPANVPSCVTGISEMKNKEISFLPNPVTSELVIKVGNNEQLEINIYDIYSKKQIIQSFSNTVILNMSHLENGIYFYELKNKQDLIKSGKLLKQ